MLRHVCFVVCASIFLTTASPAPRMEILDFVPTPPPTTVLPGLDGGDIETVGTIKPYYVTVKSFPRLTKSNSETEEPANDGDSTTESVTSDPTSDTRNYQSKDESPGSDNGISESGSENSEKIPEDALVVNTVLFNGVNLTVYSFIIETETESEERICQEIRIGGDRLEIKCFTNPLPSYWNPMPHSHELSLVQVTISPWYLTDTFYCQEIISYFEGPLQKLCASTDQYFYQELSGLQDAH